MPVRGKNLVRENISVNKRAYIRKPERHNFSVFSFQNDFHALHLKKVGNDLVVKDEDKRVFMACPLKV